MASEEVLNKILHIQSNSTSSPLNTHDPRYSYLCNWGIYFRVDRQVLGRNLSSLVGKNVNRCEKNVNRNAKPNINTHVEATERLTDWHRWFLQPDWLQQCDLITNQFNYHYKSKKWLHFSHEQLMRITYQECIRSWFWCTSLFSHIFYRAFLHLLPVSSGAFLHIASSLCEQFSSCYIL